MKKVHLIFAGAFAALALVACSDDELETETNTGTDTETEEGNTGEEEEAPQAYITLSEAELHFGKAASEATVTVDANYDWDCEYESDWFSVVADTNAGTLTVTCDANETGEVREGTVTLTAGDGEENVAEATLAIAQLAFDPESLVLEYTIETDGTEIQLPLGEKDFFGNKFAIDDCTVDWGDGSEEQTVNSCWPSHTYSAGTYNVIINGTVELLCTYDYNSRTRIDGVECLTAVKQWGNLGLKSMDSAFYDCTNLTSLPEGAGPFSNVTSFYYAFGCTSLITLPENMLSNCTSATDFEGAFYYCPSLTTVPEDMFSGCTAAENFEYVFCYCYDLTSAPSFKGLSKATDFYCAFYYCPSLTTVPEDMFSGCTAAEEFRYAFCYCYDLTSAPSFKGLSKATDFYCAFYYCTSLTTVPEDMFSNCSSATNFNSAFYGCSSLTTVSENMFSGCTAVENFGGLFGGTALTTVPEDMFSNCTAVENFAYAFYNCSNLKGESPYTMIEGNKVHLYERENYPEYFTAPTNYSYCFTDCTGLDDYYSIPSGWGGGASTTSITPQSLNAPSPEAFGPSHLGPQRDDTRSQRVAARPLPTRK